MNDDGLVATSNVHVYAEVSIDCTNISPDNEQLDSYTQTQENQTSCGNGGSNTLTPVITDCYSDVVRVSETVDFCIFIRRTLETVLSVVSRVGVLPCLKCPNTMASCCCRCLNLMTTCLGRLIWTIGILFFLTVRAAEIFTIEAETRQGSIELGSCILVLGRPCPDPDVNFFLYSNKNPEHPELVYVGDSLETTNITNSEFNVSLPTKIIIHGYNSDMYLGALVEIKHQYLLYGRYNIFAVDWARLAPAPCYPSAVANSRHVGACVAQLVERLRELGATDLHIVGFSLGAHVAGFAANNLIPYQLPRITGLDPAMPLFAFVDRYNKLDPSDAEFVDVFHTNALIQGKIEPSGHVDFYINGGVTQPGCWAEERFFACNHHRAPLYFAESITTQLGFWGWPCRNFFMYLIGLCPPKDPQILAGEHVNKTSRGFHLVITGSVSPFAVGRFTKPMIQIIKDTMETDRKNYDEKLYMNLQKFKRELLDCTDDDDYAGSLMPTVIQV